MDLYHYTDANALLSISKNREVWGTHYKSLNDSQEIVLIREVVSKYLDEICSRLRVDKHDFTWLTGSTTYLSGSSHQYIASFSRVNDDLNQWRAYAMDGLGISIGFYLKQSNLIKLGDALTFNKDFTNKLFEENFLWGEVEYIDLNKKIDPLFKFLEKVIKHYQSIKSTNANLDQFTSYVLKSIQIAAPLIKTNYFSSEKEIRCYSSFFAKFSKEKARASDKGKVATFNLEPPFHNNHFFKKNIDVRTSEKGIISFLKLSLAEIELTMGSITTGPKYNSNIWNMRVLRGSYLQEYDIEINASDIPYQ